MSKHEAVAQNRILIRFGADPDLRLWRSNTGKAWQPNTTRGHALLKELVARNPGDFRPVQYGTPGQPDVSGILTIGNGRTYQPIARSVGIEVKSDTGKPRPEQIAWRDMFVQRGGLYVLAREENDVAEALDAARRGER
jgi:hypothetical protein